MKNAIEMAKITEAAQAAAYEYERKKAKDFCEEIVGPRLEQCIKREDVIDIPTYVNSIYVVEYLRMNGYKAESRTYLDVYVVW